MTPRRKKKSSHKTEQQTSYINLVTAILQLITAIILLYQGMK